MSKSQDQKRMDDALKRMLNTPPKQHNEKAEGVNAPPRENADMSCLQRELDKLASALLEPQTPARRAQLYAAQQALAWASDPDGFDSPYRVIQEERVLIATANIQEDSADCSAVLRPLAS